MYNQYQQRASISISDDFISFPLRRVLWWQLKLKLIWFEERVERGNGVELRKAVATDERQRVSGIISYFQWRVLSSCLFLGSSVYLCQLQTMSMRNHLSLLSQVSINISISYINISHPLWFFVSEYHHISDDLVDDKTLELLRYLKVQQEVLEQQLMKSWQELDRMLFCTKLPMCVIRCEKTWKSCVSEQTRPIGLDTVETSVDFKV